MNIIRELIEFYRFKKSLRYITLSLEMKRQLTVMDKDFERELDNLVLSQLHNQVMRGELDIKTLKGAELALATRLGLMQNYTLKK